MAFIDLSLMAEEDGRLVVRDDSTADWGFASRLLRKDTTERSSAETTTHPSTEVTVPEIWAGIGGAKAAHRFERSSFRTGIRKLGFRSKIRKCLAALQ